MRYAIYFLPDPTTALWAFGSAILGYDATSGKLISPPPHPLFDNPGAGDLSEEPRRYGFHATLKPPFALASDVTEGDLLATAESLATGIAAFRLSGLRVASLGRFVALVPSIASAEVDVLAAACVRGFDHLRAPLSAGERERRLATSLTPRQIANLDIWGYPYVLQDFRFHMTLTGRLGEDRIGTVVEALSELYLPIAGPVAMDAITILKQPSAKERFIVLERFPLAG